VFPGGAKRFIRATGAMLDNRMYRQLESALLRGRGCAPAKGRVSCERDGSPRVVRGRPVDDRFPDLPLVAEGINYTADLPAMLDVHRRLLDGPSRYCSRLHGLGFVDDEQNSRRGGTKCIRYTPLRALADRRDPERQRHQRLAEPRCPRCRRPDAAPVPERPVGRTRLRPRLGRPTAQPVSTSYRAVCPAQGARLGTASTKRAAPIQR
jgi:hypothetical protein